MKEEYDRKLLYAIHYKEQYDLDEAKFKEYSEFLEFKQMLADSHGELFASDLLRDQEEQLERSFLQKQIDLDIKQFEQWKYYHGIEDPEMIRDPEYLFGGQLREKEAVHSVDEKVIPPSEKLSQPQIADDLGEDDNVNLNVVELENDVSDTYSNFAYDEIDLNGCENLLSIIERLHVPAKDTNSIQKELKTEHSTVRKDYYATKSQERQNRILEELYKLKDAKENSMEHKKERER